MSKIKIFALGGLNDSGKNMYVVEVDNDIFVFDAGLKYADDRMLGVDYIIPNFDYIKENFNRVKGLFITHGHQQQMGAVADILTELPNLKIYGTAGEVYLQNSQYDYIKSKRSGCRYLFDKESLIYEDVVKNENIVNQSFVYAKATWDNAESSKYGILGFSTCVKLFKNSIYASFSSNIYSPTNNFLNLCQQFLQFFVKIFLHLFKF